MALIVLGVVVLGLLGVLIAEDVRGRRFRRDLADCGPDAKWRLDDDEYAESFRLPAGVPIANYSSRPEPVLTAEQWDELKRRLRAPGPPDGL